MHDDSPEAVENRRPDSRHRTPCLDSNGRRLSLQRSLPTGIRPSSTNPAALLRLGQARITQSIASHRIDASVLGLLRLTSAIRRSPIAKNNLYLRICDSL